MRQIEKILLCADFSPQTELLIRYVENFSTHLGAEIFGVHVIPDIVSQFSAYSSDLGHEIENWMVNLKNKAKVSMDEMEEIAKEWRVKYHGVVLVGEPWEEILSEAIRRDVDMIAVGGTGQNPLNRFFLGSTTLKILRNSTIPVLVIGRGMLWKGIKRILVPVDIRGISIPALKFAMKISRSFEASLTFLHILELHAYESPPETSEKLRRIIEKVMEKNLTNITLQIGMDNTEGNSLSADIRVIKSINGWTGIVTFAEEEGFDIIIMNTNQRKGFSRLFLGSVTEKVVQENRLPVIAIPPTESTERVSI